MVFQNNVIAGAAGSGTTVYEIEQSIRFNSADSAYMEKTFSGAGNKKQFTISLWLKRSLLGSRQDVWSYQQDVPIIIQSDDTFLVALFGTTSLVTNRVFRDPSAWYHFVLTVDSTNQISTDRIRLYVNGQRETSFSTESYPTLNADANVWTSGLALRLFRLYGGTNYYDGYAAEIHYLDGISYGPENFGEVNSSGIWIPKEYSGSYGSNGFKIDGRDSADLGDDESGNGNDFTTSGLGAHDQVLDTPTNNFPTLNPISSDGLAAGELTGGNLEMRNIEYIDATMPFPTSGKWYWELCTVSKTQGNWNYGNHYFRDVEDQFPDSNFTDYITTNFYHGSNFYSSSNWTDGDFWTNANEPSAGDVFGFAWDSDNKKIWLAKNNTYFGSGNPAGNSGTPLGSGGTAGVEYLITMYSTLSQVMTLNFGQDDTFNNSKTSGSAGAADGNGVGKFYYAPPTGFLSLCSKNKGS
jgi:hypothetical protein